MSDEFLVKSVAKAFNALDFVLTECLGKKGTTLTEIAAHLGIQQTTTRNILKTMEQCGYVSRMDGHRYAPGSKCYDMQRSTALAGGLVDFIRPFIKEAARVTGETYILASISNGTRIPLLQARGEEMINVEPSAAESQSIYRLVTTRIMLAYMNKAEIEYFVKQNGLPQNDWKGVTTEEELFAALSSLKNKGCAEENFPDLKSFAVPFFAKGKILAGSVGTYLPRFRHSEEKEKALMQELKKIAENLNKFLETENFNN